MSTLVKWLLFIAACVALAYGVVTGYEMWRNSVVDEGVQKGRAQVQADWDEDVRKRDTEKLVAVTLAVAKERAMADAVVQGERDARKKAEELARTFRADAIAARGNASGLSGDIAALDWAARNIGIPDAASCPGEFEQQRKAAMRARKLLSACSTEYQAVAERVDESWGRLTLQLDTALKYIDAVTAKR